MAAQAPPLDEKFRLAVDYIQNLPPSGPYNPSNDEKLQFYSLYKQATEGACQTKKPSLVNPIGRMKWDAWKKVSKLSADEAKKKYITIFTRVARKINNDESKEILKKLSGTSVVASAAAGTEEDGVVHLYGTLLSQPTRTILWFCLLNDIEIKFHLVNLMKGEHKTPEFTEKNPLQKVPVIVCDGQARYESHSILRFLTQRFNTAEHWYPRSDEEWLQVETYLDWHHMNTRKSCAGLVFNKYFKALGGQTLSEEQLTLLEKEIHLTFKSLDRVFLKDRNYLASNDRPTIADLSAYHEIIQLDLIGSTGPHTDASKYPQLVQWMERMKKLPHHDEVVAPLRKQAERSQPASKL